MTLVHNITGEPLNYMPHQTLVCIECGTPHPSFATRCRKYCVHCSYQRSRKAWRRWQNTDRAVKHDAIRRITKTAVRCGFLANPKTLPCADCGKPAQCYDHRDYNKPLEVEAVCLPCNGSRGPGIPLNRELNTAA